MMQPSSGANPDWERWEQAHEWFLTLQTSADQELSSQQMDAFQRWASDERNLQAFDRVEEVMGDRRLWREREVANRMERDADDYDPRITMQDWHSGVRPRRFTLKTKQYRRFTIAAGIAASAVAALLIVPPYWAGHWSHDTPKFFETKAGMQRQIHLEDGSSVVMSPQTALSVLYTEHRRRIVLDRGEALFQVAHNAARPFVVDAGTGSTTAVGTAFDVRRDSDRVVVTVTDGTVSVAPHGPEEDTSKGLAPISPADRPQWAEARVTRGQRMVYPEEGTASAIEPIDPQAATAWREGRLQFNHEPLKYVLEAVNRYSKRQIIADDAAGELLYTGDVLPDQVDAWIRGLERIFPVQTLDADDEHVLIRSSVQAIR
jgi:transmembrane sensor